MNKNLLATPARRTAWLAALLVWLLALVPRFGHAQVYYGLSDAGTTTNDQVRRAPLGGGTETTIVNTNTTNYPASPGAIAYDAANNRLLVLNNFNNTPYIAAVNLNTNAVTTFLTPAAIPGAANTTFASAGIAVANGNVYYGLSDAGTTKFDQLRSYPLNGGTETTIVNTNTTNYPASPGAIAYDAANNRLLVLNNFNNTPYIAAVNLNTNAVTTFLTPAAIPGATNTTFASAGIAVANGNVYYGLSDAGTTTNDQLRSYPLGGGTETTIVNTNTTNYPASPGYMAYDAANNRLLVLNNFNNTPYIAAVNLNTNAVTTFLTPAAIPGAASTTFASAGIVVAAQTPTTISSITTTTTSPTNASSITYTVTFAAGVTGLTSGNFSLSPTVAGASIGTPTVVSGSNNTQYTVTVSTGTSDGTLQLNLATDAGLTPGLSNDPYAGPAITIDKTAPTTTISSTAGSNGSTTTTTPIPFTVTFSENVTGFQASDVTVGNGTLSGFSGSGAIYTFNVTPATAGTATTVNVAANRAQDAAGNNNTAASQFSIIYQQPVTATPVLTAPANGSYVRTNQPEYRGTAAPNSAINIFRGGVLTDTTFANGLGNFHKFSNIALADGQYSVYVTATASGSATSANSNTNIFTVDTTPPTVTLSSGTVASSGTTSTSPVSFTATFSEPVTSFTSAGILVSGGTLTSGPTAGSGNTYTFQVTPSGAGTVSVRVLAGAARDLAGNNNTGSSIYSFTYQLPTVTVAAVTGTTPSPTATATVNYAVTFSGSVSGLNINNFNLTTSGISGASVTSVSNAGSNTYTVVVSTGTGDGTLRLNVNNSTGVTPTISNVPYTSGTTYTITKSFAAAPTLRIQAAGSNSGNGDVTAFVDVVQVLQSGTSTAVANALQNASFETNNVDPNSFRKASDAVAVVANPWSFTSTAGVSRNNSAFGSVAADGDAVALVQSVGNNDASISQNLAVPTGTYQVRFQTMQRNYTSKDQRLNVFLVQGGNTVFIGNIQPNSSAPPTYDTFISATFNVTAPALTATVSTTSASPTSTVPIPFSVSFSQSVGSTFTASDVTVANGTVTSGSFSGSGAGPYTFTVAPSGTGPVSVSLAAGVATDANNTPSTASNTVSVQYSQPVTATPTLNFPTNNGFVRTSRPEYRGTAAAGSLINIFRATGSGSFVLTDTTYANTLGNYHKISNATLADGQYSVYVTATASGQATSANSTTNTFTVDTTVPIVTSLTSTTVANNGSTSTSPVLFTATFSEPVTGFTSAGIQVTGGTVTSAPTAGSGNTYSFQVTPSGPGSVTVQVRANAAQDQAGSLNPASALYSLTFVAPTIAIGPTALPNGQQGTAYSQALSASGGTAPYTFAITAGALPSGLTLTNGTIAGTPTTNGTFNFTVTATDASTAPGPYSGSQAYSLFIAAPAITATTWTGTISTDWFTAGNWTQGVPNATIDATIPTAPSGGRFPAISAGTATARNLTFNSGATLNQSGGTIALAANLTNNGTFLPTGGTVNLGTTTLSSVLGSSNIRFWNLTVGANGAQLSASIGASVQRLLTLNGNFSTSGNSFVLESNNTLTALVVNNNSNVVTGTVTVQRAIDGSVNPGLGYRHYSSPVSNSTVGDLATSGFTPVVNPAFNTVASPYTITPYPTVYGYDDSRLTLTNNLDMFDKGYFSPSTLSDPLAVGKGYTVNIAASELVDFQGTLNNGNLSLNLTSTRNTYPADGGWQFLGNPYPAPLDYSQVAAADRSGLESAIYIYSSTSQYQGRYRVYINGIGNPIVPLGQGYFARVASGNTTANMTFRNSQRSTVPVTNGTTLQRTTADPRPLVQLTLQGQGAAPADEAYVYFENGATSGFEPAFDAEKLPNPTGFNLSTTQAGKQLSVDGQPELGTTQRVLPLAVGVPAAGVYTLAVSQLLNLSAVPVYLRDRQLGTLTDLRQQPTYQFTVANAAALNTTRFELVFSPQQVLATVPAALAQQVAVYPNPATSRATIELPAALSRQPATATMLDALGRVVRQQPLPTGRAAHVLLLNDLATGVYSLRLTTEVGVVVKKLVVE